LGVIIICKLKTNIKKQFISVLYRWPINLGRLLGQQKSLYINFLT